MMMPDCFLDSLKGQQRHRTAVACVALVLVVPAPVMASNKEICVAAHALCQQLSLQHQTVEAREQLVICSDHVCPGLVREDCSQWLVEMDMKLVSVSARPLVAAARPPRVTHDVPQVYTKAMAPRGQPGRSLGSQSLSKSSQAPWIAGTLGIVAFGSAAYFGIGGWRDAETPPDALGEDVLVQGDAGLENAQDLPTDKTVDNRIGDSGDLATEALSADAATVCSVPPLVNATLTSPGAVSFVTACGYSGSALPRIHASVDSHTFAASAACGMCIQVQTAAATVEAMVVDLGGAPVAVNPTSLAVSRSGMDLLVPDGSTYVTQDVRWKVTACTLRNPGMSFTFQAGSNANYAAVLVQNHRYALAKVEYKTGTTYKALLRMPYNFWVAPQGMGSGSFTLRMTDQFGQTVEQSGIPLVPGQIFNGDSQFPLCSAS